MNIHRLLRTVPEGIERGCFVRVPRKDSATPGLVVGVTSDRTELTVHVQNAVRVGIDKATQGGGLYLGGGVVVYAAHQVEPLPAGLQRVEPLHDGAAMFVFADGGCMALADDELQLIAEGLGWGEGLQAAGLPTCELEGQP